MCSPFVAQPLALMLAPLPRAGNLVIHDTASTDHLQELKMGIETLVAEMRFRRVTPEMSVPPHSGHLAEAENTLLPESYAWLKPHLAPLHPLPAFCTFPIAALIQLAVAQMPPEFAYLNIGVWQGYTLFAGMLGNPEKICIGVDNFSDLGGPRGQFFQGFHQLSSACHAFYELDYQVFFETVPQVPVGVYYYDGPHTPADQRLGLELVKPHLAPGALVFVDDTNWDEARLPTEAFLQQNPDFQLLADLRTAHNFHPTFWNGLMILKKSGSV